MKTLRALAFVSLACSGPALANGVAVEVESGAVWQTRNDVQSPPRADGPTPAGSRFSIGGLLGSGAESYVRLRGSYTWGDRHSVHVLYAPLSLAGTGPLPSAVSFQGRTFAAGIPTRAAYRFDSYRLGYRYRLLDRGTWDLWLGGVLKIRDADIALTQGATAANRANTGPVPLLSLAARADLAPRWSARLDVEGLAAPQGRAVDAAVKLRYAVNDKVGLSTGYRTLEGGADNDSIYTFAWLHYALVSVDVRF
jgi:hypothetical protein